MSARGGSVLIRPAVFEDRAFALATVMRLGSFGPPPWRTEDEIGEADARVVRTFFESPPAGASLLVAESDGASLGFMYLETLRDYFVGEEHGHVGILAVTETAEGKGAGGALMRAAEDWARERGYRKLTLNVFDGNARARAIYDHFGYRPETVRYVKLL